MPALYQIPVYINIDGQPYLVVDRALDPQRSISDQVSFLFGRSRARWPAQWNSVSSQF
jgi:hypothetical protein